MEPKPGRNKLFRGENGPKKAKWDMWVPLSNLIKKKEKKKNNKTKAYDQSSWTEGKAKVRF